MLEPHEIGEVERGLPPLPTRDEVEGLDDDIVPRLEVLAMLERQDAAFPKRMGWDFLPPLYMAMEGSPVGDAVMVNRIVIALIRI